VFQTSPIPLHNGDVVELTLEEIRRILGAHITDEEAQTLAGWYANLARGVAAFSQAEMKCVEPPLRSTPGPT